MTKNIKNNREIEFVNYLRGFAVISILLCHYMPESSNVYLQMSAQFFNIGVNIFIIISGFCLGLQGEITDVKSWYRKRLKRIYIPYWIFLFLLSVVYIVKRLRFNFLNWLSCILGIQGANVGVWGGGSYMVYYGNSHLLLDNTPHIKKISSEKNDRRIGLGGTAYLCFNSMAVCLYSILTSMFL